VYLNLSLNISARIRKTFRHLVVQLQFHRFLLCLSALFGLLSNVNTSLAFCKVLNQCHRRNHNHRPQAVEATIQTFEARAYASCQPPSTGLCSQRRNLRERV